MQVLHWWAIDQSVDYSYMLSDTFLLVDVPNTQKRERSLGTLKADNTINLD